MGWGGGKRGGGGQGVPPGVGQRRLLDPPMISLSTIYLPFIIEISFTHLSYDLFENSTVIHRIMLSANTQNALYLGKLGKLAPKNFRKPQSTNLPSLKIKLCFAPNVKSIYRLCLCKSN